MQYQQVNPDELNYLIASLLLMVMAYTSATQEWPLLILMPGSKKQKGNFLFLPVLHWL